MTRPAVHTVLVAIPLGDFSHFCAWCGKLVLLKYERLVDADGKTLIECLCNACAGMAMIAHQKETS